MLSWDPIRQKNNLQGTPQNAFYIIGILLSAEVSDLYYLFRGACSSEQLDISSFISGTFLGVRMEIASLCFTMQPFTCCSGEEYQWCSPDHSISWGDSCSVPVWLWLTSTSFLHQVLLQFQTDNYLLSSSLAACLTQPELHEDSMKVEKDHPWYFSFWCPAHLFLSQPATEHNCSCTWNSFQPLQNLTGCETIPSIRSYWKDFTRNKSSKI